MAVYNYKFFKQLPENMYPAYLRKFYKEIMGKRLNLDNPKRLSEKIQWLKLYDLTPLKTQLTDKLGLREYCNAHFPEINFAKVYTSGSRFEELNFDICPDEIVVKCNHACQEHVFVKDKNLFIENYEFQKMHWNKILASNYAFNSYFELQYKDIKSKIFIEEHVRNSDLQDGYVEYRISCFNGEPKFIELFIQNKVAFFDTNWNKLGIEYKYYQNLGDNQIIKPQNLDKMLELAKQLSKDFKFVRVDMYEYNNKIYLSEMTFTPFSGFIQYAQSENDDKFGQYLTI